VACLCGRLFLVSVSEQFCDVASLFACVCEYSPGLCCGFSLWVWRDIQDGFLGGGVGRCICFLFTIVNC